MAAAGKGDGLMRWLVGGLLVGFAVLGLMIGSYAVGHNRGETKEQEAAPSTTAPATTEPTTTEPATTEPATTETTPTTTPADLAAEGKELFTSAGCAGCHTLADAGASGTVGPNLDQVKPSEQLVVDRVTNGLGAMPSFSGQLDAEQIKAVATYVSQASGG